MSIPNYLKSDDVSKNDQKFLMLPPDILDEPAFQELSHAGKMFYISLCLYKQTEEQMYCLEKSLNEYNRIFKLGMKKVDIEMEAYPHRYKKEYSNNYFVAPQKELLTWGYSKSYICKLKKELIEKKFIKIVYGGKGKYNAWNDNNTIYQFLRWRKKSTSP